MKITIPSNRGEFRAFSAFFEAEIKPYLTENEDVRQQAVMQAGLMLIATAVVAGSVLILGPLGDANFQVGFIIGFLGLGAAGWRINRTRNDITGGLLQRICEHLGFGYDQSPGRSVHCETFERLKMLPNYNRESWEDAVTGERNGAQFSFCEAHLKYKTSGKNRSTRTVFHGQLMVIDYHKEFLGETVVRRDAGLLNRLMKPGKSFQNVGLASGKFEKIFEAWSTDQVEARELLDPLVLERFEELDRLFDGAKIRAAFTGGKLFLALETGDKLNMGSMFTPLNGPARVEKILAEFDLIFDLIDVLIKSTQGRIDGAFTVDAVRQA